MAVFHRGLSKREIEFAGQIHAAIAAQPEHVPVYLYDNRTGSRAHRGEAPIFVRGEPYNPLSPPAQATGAFLEQSNAMVPAARSEPGLGSTRPLCGACWNAFTYTSQRTAVYGETAPLAVIHHPDLNSLQASVRAGCGLCRELQRRVALTLPKPPGTLQLEILWPGGGKESPRSTIYFGLTLSGLPRAHLNYETYYWMHAFPLKDFATSFELPGTTSPERGDSTSSKSSRELARRWFRCCTQNAGSSHDLCHVCDGGGLPARLLDAETARRTGILKLVPRENIPQDSEYVTLSYVWGPHGREQLPLVTSSNLRMRQEVGLKVLELPKTLSDAVEVSGWFDAKWLWIDCMCILQDSSTDWKKEAESMSKTYRNAIVNISADVSADTLGGCFATRDPKVLTSWQMTMQVKKWYVRPHQMYEYEQVRSTPSSERAWIYRERQLSRRVLHFTENEIIWECCGTGYASETYPGGSPYGAFDATYGGEGKYQWLMADQRHMSKEKRSNEPVFSTHELWNLLCDSFSSRRLSKPADMPMIISGLAQDFVTRLPYDEYAAGLWLSTLPRSLLWKTTGIRQSDQPFAAPSWSWLCLGNGTELRGEWAQIPLLQLESVEMDPSFPLHHPNRVGCLNFKGFMREIRFEGLAKRGALDHSVQYHFEKLSLCDDETRPLGPSFTEAEGWLSTTHWDTDMNKQNDCYYCLFVTLRQVQNERSIDAIILEKVEGPKPNGARFKRVGIVTFKEPVALRVRYRVRKRRTMGRLFHNKDKERRWEDLEHQFHTNQSNDTTKEDGQIDPRRVDPLQLYRYDTLGDYSWLERLTPQSVALV